MTNNVRCTRREVVIAITGVSTLASSGCLGTTTNLQDGTEIIDISPENLIFSSDIGGGWERNTEQEQNLNDNMRLGDEGLSDDTEVERAGSYLTYGTDPWQATLITSAAVFGETGTAQNHYEEWMAGRPPTIDTSIDTSIGDQSDSFRSYFERIARTIISWRKSNVIGVTSLRDAERTDEENDRLAEYYATMQYDLLPDSD